MVEKLTIGQATGRKVHRDPYGNYIFLHTYDPFLKQWTGDGYDGGPVFGIIRDSELLERGLEICPSKEELDVIEALRLTNRVSRASIELGAALDAWLKNPLHR